MEQIKQHMCQKKLVAYRWNPVNCLQQNRLNGLILQPINLFNLFMGRIELRLGQVCANVLCQGQKPQFLLGLFRV